MLKLENIIKEYKTGDFIQKALNGINLNLRDNEFVAVLGPSGSGKTTLLNIIGGLDQYDEGDLVINDISTKKYKDKNWDAYRNHSVGFVFQNYNLIPHQNILSNVELALTISGISKQERKERAKKALEQVGLKEHMYKLPSQLSGGQMQRVAIARALVNDPEILLADEPTGALDSETSVQIMDLLKDVAKDRLVVMVTHNPELAQNYATRIVTLKDGQITGDTNPLRPEEFVPIKESTDHGKTKMSFWTALSLSFSNLLTKKTRTILTAFAGSIGIIGIAMILSISNGVDKYITDIQKETMTSYPVTIQSQSIDLSSILDNENGTAGRVDEEIDHDREKIYSNPRRLEQASTITNSISENNLTDFKKYLDDPDSEIHQYIGENGIVYSYDTKFDLYGRDPNDVLINTKGTEFGEQDRTIMQQGVNNFLTVSSSNGPVNPSQMQGEEEDNNAEELIPGQDGALISTAITDQFELLSGQWPAGGDEVVLVLDHNNEIPAQIVYELGLLPNEEYRSVMDKIDNGEEVVLDSQSWYYEDVVGKTYGLLTNSDYYVENDSGTFDYVGDNEERVTELLNNALPVRISGVVRASDEDAEVLINSPIGYTQELTNYIIDKTNNSAVVQAQEADPEVNVLNGFTFSPADDQTKIDDAISYLNGLNVSERASMMLNILDSMGQGEAAQAMSEEQLSAYLDNFLADPDDAVLLDIYNNYISTGTYDDNLADFGKVSLDAPSQISIYADSFEDKDGIATSIENYNKGKPEEDQIHYTDLVRLLMSSVTTILNVITWVLVAFVSVSLVVSSIMIGIITYISVLERTKEIGILRSIGASKGNITEVFTAETFIIGLLSGIIGIGVTLLLLIPANAIIHSLAGTTDVNAYLPFWAAIVLIVLSVILTLIGGFIPSRGAAKKNPVTALRTE